MQQYKDFRPSQFDSHLAVEGQEDWFVVPCNRNRDSNCFEESNFTVALDMLGGESDEVAVHRFGHWACGWFEIILVQPETPSHQVAEEIEEKLDNYPILDEDDLTERQRVAADETWKNCYSSKERVAYIRRHCSQFEFHDMLDLMQCVRGYHFAGYASELIGE